MQARRDATQGPMPPSLIKNWIGVGLGGCPLGGTKGWGLPGMAGFSMEPPSGGGCGGLLESLVPDFTIPTSLRSN